jgi:hypothetical protein
VSTKIYYVNESFVKIGPLKALLYLKARWIPSHTCHVRCSAKFGIRDQHISCWTFVRFVNTGTRQAALALCVWMKHHALFFPGLWCIIFFCVLLPEDLQNNRDDRVRWRETVVIMFVLGRRERCSSSSSCARSKTVLKVHLFLEFVHLLRYYLPQHLLTWNTDLSTLPESKAHL